MRNTQNQIPLFRIELFLSNKLAVPRLGNVRLRLHFLRRGTSGVNSPALVRINASVSNIKAYTIANNFTPPAGSNDYLQVCDNTQIVNTVYFPTALIGSDRGPIKTDEVKNVEVFVQSELVDIRSRGTTSISKVQVFDLLGRTVVKHSDINSEHFKLPINQFQQGTYLIQVLDSEGNPYTTKLQR